MSVTAATLLGILALMVHLHPGYAYAYAHQYG